MSLRLTIPEPCHENWQNMEPNKVGRHCMSCRKTVVDFSLMSDKEILDHIAASNGQLCGRFDPHQLNRNLNEGNPRKRISWIYIWQMLVVGLLWTGRAKAQGTLVKYEKKEQIVPQPLGNIMPAISKSITGKVVNELTGEPVPFASISAQKGSVATSADSAGNFVLENFRAFTTGKITFSAIGFASQKIRIGRNNPGMLTIYLVPEAEELEAVEVRAIGVIRKRNDCNYLTGIVGGLVTSVRVSKTEKIKRTINELLPKKDVVVSPNPVVPGNTLNVALQLKETGQYRVELIDAAGKLVWIQSMNIPSKKYNFSLTTQSTWSAGIYWLRITGRHAKDIYNSRIVLQ